MRKRPRKQRDVQNSSTRDSQIKTAALSTDATFPLPTFETFKTKTARHQLSGAVDLALYHNAMQSLRDSQLDYMYMQDWIRISQDIPGDISLIENVLLEDALIVLTQVFDFVKSKPISTAEPEIWARIIDALCCACRLSCSPYFASEAAPGLTVPGVVVTVAMLCDAVFRLANRRAIGNIPSSCADLPNVSPDNWTRCIYRDIICGRGSAWISLAKVNAWQTSKRWPLYHEAHSEERALILMAEMQQYNEDSTIDDMREALDLAILMFAKTYRDISVKNRSADIDTASLEIFPKPADSIVFDIPELNGGYGDIFGVDPLEQVAFLSQHYREVALLGA